MVVILTTQITERLRYICQLIFGEQLNIPYSLFTNLNYNAEPESLVIHYHDQFEATAGLQITPHPLLFEKGIQQQEIKLFHFTETSNTTPIPAFFATKAVGFPFDIFAASFYLLSRYEEYLTEEKDEFGRFPHTASLAFQHDFLSSPLVNIWIMELCSWMKKKLPTLPIQPSSCTAHITYDLDMAWSYRNKGWFRQIAGWLNRPNMERWEVLLGRKKDPFDCFDYLINTQSGLSEKSRMFVLSSSKRSRYDKNIPPSHPAMQSLLQNLNEHFQIELHPSWSVKQHPELISKEKQSLQNIINQPITSSRQHYILFDLPDTYRHLLQYGIKQDYSMGYGSINGFRASFAGSFFWYDLKQEMQTQLRLFPFCFMDANSRFEQKQDVSTTLDELKQYLNISRTYNGLFISIFHQHLMGNDNTGMQWRRVHDWLISQIR